MNTVRTRARNVRLGLVLAAAGIVPLAVSARASAVNIAADADLGCDAVVYDPQGELDADAVRAAAARTAVRLGADVRVRAEDTEADGIDARVEELRDGCEGWSNGAQLADDLVLVMFSSHGHEGAIYYGAGQSEALDARWEPALDKMFEFFPEGCFSDGLVAGLSLLRTGASTSPSTPVGCSIDGGA